jgi:Fur family transcriptional regulator, ferric uptake regulator
MKSRRTRSQNQVLELLKQLKDAISAQDLYLHLRQHHVSMGLATVYRALESLKLEGAVQVRTLSSGESLYSPAQEDTHHLTCVRCGLSTVMEECPVHGLETHLTESHHFQIFYHTLEFFGLCEKCQEDVPTEVPANVTANVPANAHQPTEKDSLTATG